MNKGWIKLYRSLKDSWLWQEDRYFSRAEAWIDILLMVNHADKKIFSNGQLIVVKAGSVLTSLEQLSKRWNWSRDKVKKFLLTLSEDEMITFKTTSKNTLVTVDKWAFYQSSAEKNDIKTTTEQHQNDIKTTTARHQNDTNKKIKNDKKIKNEKKKDIGAFFESIWALYPNQKGKSNISDKQKEKLYAIGFDEMKRAIERYSAENVNTDIQYWKYGSTFFNSGYIDYLDENYQPKAIQDHNNFKTTVRELDFLVE